MHVRVERVQLLSVNSPALILSKNSGVFLAKIGYNRLKTG